jgi:ferritin-like metal-binding protein YciE
MNTDNLMGLRSSAMARETLNDLLLDEIKDTYDAEQQITQALPKMVKAATSAGLKKAFEQHLKQTEGHIARLEQIFKIMGEKPQRKTCKAMKGLLAEGEDLMKDHKASPLLDAGLVGAAQRVEHYEIAAYGTSRAYAEALGQTEIAGLLQQTLDEEKQTDETLTKIGEPINQQCAKASEGVK